MASGVSWKFESLWKRVVYGAFPWKRTKQPDFRRYFKNNPTKEEIRG